MNSLQYKIVRSGKYYRKYVAIRCLSCHKKRWARDDYAKTRNYKYSCKGCDSRSKLDKAPKDYWKGKGMDSHPSWKGGRIVDDKGYVYVYLNKKDPLFVMAGSKGYVFEHRLVMARKMGRTLLKHEVVHHKNGRVDDNRLSNLELLTKVEHDRFNLKERWKRVKMEATPPGMGAF